MGEGGPRRAVLRRDAVRHRGDGAHGAAGGSGRERLQPAVAGAAAASARSLGRSPVASPHGEPGAMRRLLLLVLASVALASGPVRALQVSDATVDKVTACIRSAAAVHRVPPGVIAILLAVEGGTLGRVSQNGNGTVDIGPMQINQIHCRRSPGAGTRRRRALVRHWRTVSARTWKPVRGSCALPSTAPAATSGRASAATTPARRSTRRDTSGRSSSRRSACSASQFPAAEGDHGHGLRTIRLGVA